MTTAPLIKRTSAAIKTYYQRINEVAAQGATHELAVRDAFTDLLKTTVRARNLTLIPEESIKVGGKTIRPDATVRDEWHLPHGLLESKDTADDLNTEITKKINKGYPLNNTIFEDTRTAVLFQNAQRVKDYNLRDEQEVADLINEFLLYQAPNHGKFEEAVANFAERIPDLAIGLNEKIKEAHKSNKNFQTAYAAFYEIARTALNPNLSKDAVDEMLIQHLLTERLIRRIFNNEEFVQRNVIAAEIEKVIGALTSGHFNRTEFLGALDRFYKAIEDTAQDLSDFTEKQHFLNTVYERFFQGYSVKTADTHGIVYTPQEIVDFMCAAVEEVLRDEFGAGLGDDGVNILDPATGTGNFIVHLLRRMPKDKLDKAYREQMFANEVMLMPYYIASLNIEHEYYELTGKYAPFEGLCFVDTLDLAQSQQMSFFAQANTERVERQKNTPITVIIGNPPYNVGQINESDNNKNRTYDVIDKRIRETYAKDSKASSKTKINDAYVRFFRWATDRLQGQDGIVCYVTNNSFVDQIAFDGMRKHLLQDFTQIYHIDLHGNIRQNPKLSGTTHNVFGIQVGVGITVAIRSAKHTQRKLCYHRVPEFWRKEQKTGWLATNIELAGKQNALNTITWEQLTPDSRHTWRVPENADDFASFLPIGSKETKSAKSTNVEAIFKTFSLGVATNRDEHVYSYDLADLTSRCETFIEIYSTAVDKLRRKSALNDLIDTKDGRIKWTRQVKSSLKSMQPSEFNKAFIRAAMYRPFTKKYLYYDKFWNEEPRLFDRIFPTVESEQSNLMIGLTTLGSEKPFMAFVAQNIVDLHMVGAGSGAQCFPVHIYSEDGTQRRDNITDWALDQFRTRYSDPTITKEDIFYYTYGILHHPAYRAKYADNLKRELPRIPFAPDFRAFESAGRKLADLHLNYEQQPQHPTLKREFKQNKPLTYRVEKMRLSKDKSSLTVNDSLTITGIPAAAFDYRLGNRSALDWVIDQYQTKEDKRSKIKSDPNNPDDPEYIVNLVGQVIHVSVETVKIVNALPSDFGG